MNKIRAKIILPSPPYYYVYFKKDEIIQIVNQKPDKIE